MKGTQCSNRRLHIIKRYSASHTVKTAKYLNYHLSIMLACWLSFVYHSGYHDNMIKQMIDVQEMLKTLLKNDVFRI